MTNEQRKILDAECKRSAPFVQLCSAGVGMHSALYALDADGNVWAYNARDFIWDRVTGRRQ